MSLNKKSKKFQEDMAIKLRNGEIDYNEASIYTVLLDLCQGNGALEVLNVLELVAKEFDFSLESNKEEVT